MHKTGKKYNIKDCVEEMFTRCEARARQVVNKYILNYRTYWNVIDAMQDAAAFVENNY